MVQYFKGDDLEIKFDQSASDVISNIKLSKDEFFDGAYITSALGDMIFESQRSPLSNAITQSIFRISFSEIFESFVQVGTFEAYINVFEKIFGSSVDIVFNVPSPGKLEIDITAEGIELSNFLARFIQDNTYLFDRIVDDIGDGILFQTIKGFQSQYELEQMLFEMVPAGIKTDITLTLGA